MMQALPYIILGVFITIGTILFIAGCAISRNWWPFLNIIPALFTAAISVWYLKMDKDSYEGGCFITTDSLIFLCMLGGCSIIAMPIVFYHIGVLNGSLALGMNLGGTAVFIVGFIIYLVLSEKQESEYGF